MPDIMTIEQMNNLLSKVAEKDNTLWFDKLHPAAEMYLSDALRQGIRWGKELEELKKKAE